MAKASKRDIEAAGNAMAVLNDISSGYCPVAPGSDDDDESPVVFDRDDINHLRSFYDLMSATLEISQGWPGRVIGGMCYVILFDKNEIVDPAADVLELHPKFANLAAAQDELVAAMKEVIAISDRKHDAWDRAKAAISRAEGGAI